MARFAKVITMAGADFNLKEPGSPGSGIRDSLGNPYNSPSVNDKIIITPLDHSTHEGNIQLWLYWDSGASTWKIKASDSTFAGKILVVIKT